MLLGDIAAAKLGIVHFDKTQSGRAAGGHCIQGLSSLGVHMVVF